jgi:hypothetical protein
MTGIPLPIFPPLPSQKDGLEFLSAVTSVRPHALLLGTAVYAKTETVR